MIWNYQENDLERKKLKLSVVVGHFWEVIDMGLEKWLRFQRGENSYLSIKFSVWSVIITKGQA